MSAAKSDAGKQDKYNQIQTGTSTDKYIQGQVQSNQIHVGTSIRVELQRF